MQAIARWGNFFNQELYGSPTTLPWGIPIDCAHRIAAYPCATFPLETTRFHPLFLYESLSGLIGLLALVWIGYHLRRRLRPGDLLLLFFIWYGIVRFTLEAFRSDNWTFFGVPTAQVVSAAFIVLAVVDPRVATPTGSPGRRSADASRGRRPGVRRAVRSIRRAAASPTRRRGSDPDAAPDLELPAATTAPAEPDAAAGLRWATRASRPTPTTAGGRRPPASRPRRWPRPAAARWRASRGSVARRRPGRRCCTGSCGSWRGSSASSSSGSGSGRPARRSCRRGGYFLVAAAHRGWMDPFVVMHALPTEPRAWFLGQRAVDVHLALARAADPPARRASCRCGAAASGSTATSRRRARSSPTAPSSSRCRKGPSAVRRAGSGRSATAGRSSRSGPEAPIVPLAIAGTEELYLGRRMASQVLPPTTARALAGLRADDALPAPGSREELETARRMSDALAAILGPVVEALYPWTVDPPTHPRRLRRRLTWLLLRPGRLDRDG